MSKIEEIKKKHSSFADEEVREAIDEDDYISATMIRRIYGATHEEAQEVIGELIALGLISSEKRGASPYAIKSKEKLKAYFFGG